jgi:hypothetical protein
LVDGEGITACYYYGIATNYCTLKEIQSFEVPNFTSARKIKMIVCHGTIKEDQCANVLNFYECSKNI